MKRSPWWYSHKEEMPAISRVCCAWIQSVNLNTKTGFNAVDITAQGCFFRLRREGVVGLGTVVVLDDLDVVVPSPLKEGWKRNGNWFESPNGPAMRNSEQFNKFVEGEYVMQIADRKRSEGSSERERLQRGGRGGPDH